MIYFGMYAVEGGVGSILDGNIFTGAAAAFFGFMAVYEGTDIVKRGIDEPWFI